MEFLQNNWHWLALAITSGGALIWRTMQDAGNTISAAEATLKINRENAQVLDVREAAEFTAGHIPNAKPIPLAQLEKRIGELEKFKDTPLIVACQSGVRSGKACATLRKAGFNQVFNLNGGTPSWEQAGLPVTRK